MGQGLALSPRSAREYASVRLKLDPPIEIDKANGCCAW